MATPTNLPASTTVGQVLTADYVNNLRGAFRILQVVNAVTTTSVSTTSATYADTTLSASITPQSTSSKIIVAYSQNVYSNGSATGGDIQLVRNLPSANTVLQTNRDITYGNASGTLGQFTFFYVDSPNTTSAITYKTRFNRSNGVNTIFVQANTTTGESNIILMEVSA
jgi:hypothetical protein